MTSALPNRLPDALRVFLVEDSALVRNLMIENLAHIPGVEVIGFCETESEALEQLLKLKCDIVILDIELKEGNGMNLLRNLAQAPSRASDPIKIIFSNNVSDVYRRTGEQYGVRHFFDKSSEFSQLYALIEKLGAGV